MAKHLEDVGNWAELAKSADYRVNKLAEMCGVSRRTLHRFFLRTMKRSPRDFLEGVRLDHGLTLVGTGKSVKEAAWQLGFKDPAYFSKKYGKLHDNLQVRRDH
jgi:transcriptional regulator GlxA family with amidase domain